MRQPVAYLLEHLSSFGSKLFDSSKVSCPWQTTCGNKALKIKKRSFVYKAWTWRSKTCRTAGMHLEWSTAANLESGDIVIILRNTLIVSFSDLLANTCTAGNVREIAMHTIWKQTERTWSAPSTYCSKDCLGAAAIQRTASCCCAGGHAERPCTNQTFMGDGENPGHDSITHTTDTYDIKKTSQHNAG